jgi:hypothetical protein
VAEREFHGRIGNDWRESEPWWPPMPSPPAGAPNFVLIVLDDVGFAQLGSRLEQVGDQLKPTRMNAILGFLQPDERRWFRGPRQGQKSQDAQGPFGHNPSGDELISLAQAKLDLLAVKNAWLARFPMWDWVGGRTSELCAVGLLPAALMVGVARSISLVLEDGHIVDTILFGLVTPLARMPAISASASCGPERRPSRPTAISVWFRARASLPIAWPMSRTPATVSVLPTMPRMS